MDNPMRASKQSCQLATPVLLLAAGLAIASAHAADAPAAAPTIDPKALEALKSMGTHLRDLKSFWLHADTTIDEVDDNDQKLQFGGTVDFKVRRPDHLLAEVDTDRRHRTYYFDGKTLTQYSPRMGYYATVSAPGTLSDLADVLKNRYDLSLPLTDLFRWGTDKDDGSGITAAAVVGPATINKVECEHYAFRQPDVDWQVWIAHDTQLPCKLVITTTEDDSQPQYVALFNWHTDATFEDKTFVFDKPKTARKIEIAVVDASGN